MFTFGIFTTHLPYIAMVAFYAYFLIFGVTKASEGKIQNTGQEHCVKMHINNAFETANTENTRCYYFSFAELSGHYDLDKIKLKQKWKHFESQESDVQEFLKYNLFSRPPPALA